ncbi:hypothetical protein P7C70_g2537, partial [Phenoliferia sp. Uapishka_3]
MSGNFTSAGCPIAKTFPVDPVPLFAAGNINFKAHDVGWLIADEYALYFQLGRDCYEALVIASFFNLLVSYLSSPPPTIDDPCPQPYATREERNAALNDVVRNVHIEHWMFPFGFVKWRAAGGGKDRALAHPLRPPEPFVPSTLPKSFAAWTTLEEEAKRFRHEQARLAKMDVVDAEGHPLRKADGFPVLQRTKKLPALLKCIILSDVGRELGSQTGFVVGRAVRRKKADGNRAEDLEGALGKRRERPGANEKYEEEEYDAEDLGEDEEQPMVRPSWLREGRSPPSIGRDGRVVDPTNRGRIHPQTDMSRDRIVQDIRMEMDRRKPSAAPFQNLAVHALPYEEARLLSDSDHHVAPEPVDNTAWWGSLRKKLWAKPAESFEDNSHQETRQVQQSLLQPASNARYQPPSSRHQAPPPRTPTHPRQSNRLPNVAPAPPHSPELAEIPTRNAHYTLDVAPPHRLASGAPPFPPASQLEEHSSRRQHRERPFSLPASTNASSPYSVAHTNFSDAASGLRHPALRSVGHQPLPPPPRASRHRERERYTEYNPPSRPRRTSAPVQADQRIHRSRGLPPGAAPSAVGGSGASGRSGKTSFIFEEY